MPPCIETKPVYVYMYMYMYIHVCYEPICDHWPDLKQADQFQNQLCACSSVQGDSNVQVKKIWMKGAKNCHIIVFFKKASLPPPK